MIGERLREIRHERKLSGAKMAEFLDIPYVTYGKYERNESEPGLERLKYISRALGVSIDYLLGNSDFRDRVEDYILTKRLVDSDIEITDKDFNALGLTDSKIYKQLLELPKEIKETRQQYESVKRELENEKVDLNSKRINELKQTIVATELDIYLLEEQYESLKRIVDLSLKQSDSKTQETP